METIDQDPNDIVLQEPVKEKSDLPFKIATCILAGTTVLFGAIAFFNSNKPTETKNNDNKSESSQTESKETESEAGNDLTLKNFDVDTSSLITVLGLHSGTILTLKTNADGNYFLGEIRSNDVYHYGYRSLPSGKWIATNFTADGETALCEATSKTVLEAFAGVSFVGTNKGELKCSIEEEAEDESDPPVKTTITLTQALKDGYYKDAE